MNSDISVHFIFEFFFFCSGRVNKLFLSADVTYVLSRHLEVPVIGLHLPDHVNVTLKLL